MFRRFLALALIVALGGSSQGRAEEPWVQSVRKAMDRGIDYLKSQQKDQGRGVWNWENDTIALLLKGGPSCLVTLALLTSGVTADDPVIKRALPFIENLEPEHTYVVGLQTMVFMELNQPKNLARIQRNVNWLIENAQTQNKRQLGTGDKLLGWSYGKTKSNAADNSNTQYALLGLWAGRLAGAKIDQGVWKEIHEFYVNSQSEPINDKSGQPKAGWNYHHFGKLSKENTFSMTAAGVCGLYIASQELHLNVQGLDTATGIAKNCGEYPGDDKIAQGMRWLADDFRFQNRPHSFYNVYGIERVGRLSGQRFIGDNDWYRVGCELLTGNGPATKKDTLGFAQKAGGEWRIKGDGIDDMPVVSTSFALLFLAKGRTPILISKLAWDSAGDQTGKGLGWNRKHNDTRHLVEYASRELFKKMPLAWQVYDIRGSDLSKQADFNEELSSLLQAPILYINGHEAPRLTVVQKRMLRRYVDEGGFIIAEACCGSPAFIEGFEKLMSDKEVFGDESPLMPVSTTHPIWNAHKLVPAEMFQGEKVPEKNKIKSIERGCKTVVIFIPQPLAGYWEEARFSPRASDTIPQTDRGSMAYRLAGNIIAYATGFEPPKPRLDKPKVLDPGAEKAPLAARDMIEIAQIKHDGPDPEPAKNAMRALALHVRNNYLVDISLTKQMIPMTKAKELWSHKFVYMQGKTKFTVDENEILNMRKHLEQGGAMMLADACCGSKAFDESFRDFMRKLFPDKKLEVIPDNDFLYSEKLNGEAISKLRCRFEKEDGTAEANFRETRPLLEGIKIGDRWAVVYSRYDLGCALEKNKSSACLSYEPESALKLASAVLLYSLKK